MKRLYNLLMALLVLSLAGAPGQALACATCFGDPNSSMTKGLNMGIFSLLLVVAFVLGMMGMFAIYLMKKSAGMPPVEEESSPAVEREVAEKVH